MGVPFDFSGRGEGCHARVVELADTLALGASEGNLLRVQIPPLAPEKTVVSVISWAEVTQW